jgi:hypothetical protein
VRDLALSYSKRVTTFYEWHTSAVNANVPLDLVDYRRCDAFCDAEVARTMWRIVLTQTKADPYQHLDSYLLPEQINAAMELPMRSKQQVDYIIAAADRHGACNDEIRALVYKYFGVIAS